MKYIYSSDTPKYLDVLKYLRCTTTQGTPTMFLDMVTLQKEKKKKLCLENVMIGGAPCSPKLLKEMKEVLGLKHIHVRFLFERIIL